MLNPQTRSADGRIAGRLALTGLAALALSLGISTSGVAAVAETTGQPGTDASALVAAAVDGVELDAAVDSFTSADAEAVANLAAVVAPEEGEAFADAESVELAGDGSLVIGGGAADSPSIGVSVEGSDSTSELVDGAAVSTDVAPGLGVVARATEDGAQLLAVLADQDAPNDLRFDLDLPKGATLAEQEDGSIDVFAPVASEVALPGEDARIEAAALEILGGEDADPSDLTDAQMEQLAAIPDARTQTVVQTQKIAEIATPWAVDAAGQAVSTRFELDGDTLVQIVDTTSQTSFPVVADPNFLWWIEKGAKCLGSVVTLIGLGYAKVSVAIAKLVKQMKAATPSSNLGKAYTAWKKMGSSNSSRFSTLANGLKKMAGYVVKHGKSGIGKYKKESSTAKAVFDFIKYGGSVVASVFGLKSCYEMIKEA